MIDFSTRRKPKDGEYAWFGMGKEPSDFTLVTIIYVEHDRIHYGIKVVDDFGNGRTSRVEGWFLRYATDEEVMLHKLENA